VKAEVKKARMQFENELAEKAKKNPKLLYKYLNSQKEVNYSIKAVRISNCELLRKVKVLLLMLIWK